MFQDAPTTLRINAQMFTTVSNMAQSHLSTLHMTPSQPDSYCTLSTKISSFLPSSLLSLLFLLYYALRFFFFRRGYVYLPQDGLKLVILLLQPCRDYGGRGVCQQTEHVRLYYYFEIGFQSLAVAGLELRDLPTSEWTSLLAWLGFKIHPNHSHHRGFALAISSAWRTPFISPLTLEMLCYLREGISDHSQLTIARLPSLRYGSFPHSLTLLH